MASALKLYFHWKEIFYTEISNKDSTQKGHKKTHKKVHKKGFFTYVNVYNNSVFFGIWLSVKYRDFHIISNLSQVLEIFILVDKDKLKVQHESDYVCCALRCCTSCCFFSWKVLVTIFNLGYTYVLKDLLSNQ